jgi:hypothetical protein
LDRWQLGIPIAGAILGALLAYFGNWSGKASTETVQSLTERVIALESRDGLDDLEDRVSELEKQER